MTLRDLLLPLALLAAYVIFVWFLWRDTFGFPWSTRDPGKTQPRHSPSLRHQRVLFVCTHNSARSQMAEALLRRAASSRFTVASAGTAPTHLHPLTTQVMAEQGLSLSSHFAKSIADVGLGWDYVITVCDEAYERCPDFPVKTNRLHWSVTDPSGMAATPADQLDAFRHVRDDLTQRIEQWLAERLERA